MDRAEKIKKLISELKLGKDLYKEDLLIIKPITMEMILGYDEVSRQKRVHEAQDLVDKQLEDIKQRILKTREISSKAKTAEAKQKGEEVVNSLKQKCIPIMRHKKEISELLNNPNQPPPVIKKVDVITQIEKMNNDLAENEIKFSFKLTAEFLKSLSSGFVDYCLQLEDNGPKVEGKFDVNKDSF